MHSNSNIIRFVKASKLPVEKQPKGWKRKDLSKTSKPLRFDIKRENWE